jgi:medium-chain acyl-[acyl-carrier-protein] hydrolase
VSSNVERRSNPWMADLKPKPQAQLRLFCFPYAGGNASAIYRNWLGSSPFIEMCPIQLPGRGTRIREPAHTSLDQLVQDLAPAITPLLDKPFAFFGHSMGAMISYELARALRRAGASLPVMLFVSGRGAPHLPDPRPQTYDLPEEEFIQELRNLNGTPREVLDHPELMKLMIPLLRADFSVCQTYVYTGEPPLDCPIIVLGGLDDHEVERPLLEPWREHTTAAFELTMLAGDHFFLHSNSAPIQQIISRELRELVRPAI